MIYTINTDHPKAPLRRMFPAPRRRCTAAPPHTHLYAVVDLARALSLGLVVILLLEVGVALGAATTNTTTTTTTETRNDRYVRGWHCAPDRPIRPAACVATPPRLPLTAPPARRHAIYIEKRLRNGGAAAQCALELQPDLRRTLPPARGAPTLFRAAAPAYCPRRPRRRPCPRRRWCEPRTPERAAAVAGSAGGEGTRRHPPGPSTAARLHARAGRGGAERRATTQSMRGGGTGGAVGERARRRRT
jgi:hypothetical protein